MQKDTPAPLQLPLAVYELLKENLPAVAIIAAVVLFVVVSVDPDRVSKWGALLLWRPLFSLWDFARRRYTASVVERDANRYLTHKVFARLMGEDAPRLSVHWVRETEDPVLQHNGKVIVRMRREVDLTRNTLNALMFAAPKVFYPLLRPHLGRDTLEAIDLHLIENLARQLGSHAQKIFAVDYLQKVLDAKPGLRVLLSKLRDLDRGGLFEAVLVQELIYLGDRAQLDPPDNSLDTEVTEFIAYLQELARRAPGDESMDLVFHRRYLRIAFILLSKSVTAAAGTYPYVRRLGINIARGANSIYLLGLTPNQAEFAEEITEALSADHRVRLAKRVSVTKHGDAAAGTQAVPLVLFLRNDLFVPGETFSGQLAAANVEVGQDVRGSVRAVSPNRVLVDVYGLNGQVNAADLAWGYKGSAESLVKVGDELELRVLRIEEDARHIILGAKQRVLSPWDMPQAPAIGQKVRVEVVELLAEFIVVRIIDSGVYGRMAYHEWETDTHARTIDIGTQTEAWVADAQPEADTVTLSRRAAPSDWERARQRYPKGTPVRVTVLATDAAGIECEIEPGLRGRISAEELRAMNNELADWRDTVAPGQKLDAYVYRFQDSQRRISLRLRRDRT